MTKFACPHCEGHFEAGPEYSGQKIPCPHCRKKMEVPPPSACAIVEQPKVGAHRPPVKRHHYQPAELGVVLTPLEWLAFQRVLVVCLVAGAGLTGWYGYVQWQTKAANPYLTATVLGWLVVLAAVIMVHKRLGVRIWAGVVGGLSCLPLFASLRFLLTQPANWQVKLPLFFVACCFLAMAISGLKAAITKLPTRTPRAKVVG